MFQLHSWPNVILHLDADAFFASVAQAVNPKLKGKPLVTGNERGVATSVSYEAKKLGVKRATPIYQLKKNFPQCIIVDSDYELYDLFSQKIFSILRSYSPFVEEYSVDEAFADLKGLRRPLNMGYEKIGRAIKNKVEASLGITVSVGISLTKSLAKLASSYRRPSGLTVFPGREIESLLKQTLIEEVWGIGENTSSYLKKLGIKTALDFALRQESFIQNHLSKPFYEIWQELRGDKVYKLDTSRKTHYKSITRSHTFSLPTNNAELLWARILDHVEDAFEKARKLNYYVGKVSLFLKTQQFSYHNTELHLLKKTDYPFLIRDQLRKGFSQIYKKNVLYRAAGCTISALSEEKTVQSSLFFDENLKEEKAKKFYPLIEKQKVHFGTELYEERKLKRQRQETKRLELPIINLS